MTARDFVRVKWPAIALLITAAVIGFVTLVMLASMPPRLIVMATGPEGGTYYEVGKRYQAVLARDNVEVRLVPTAGSVETVASLLDRHSEVGVGLVQGGIIGPYFGQSELLSLGTLFYEPYWWFRRREVEGVGVKSLRGRKISIGPEGSGTLALSLQLLKKVGIVGDQGTELLSLPSRVAREKLLSGDIDVAFILAAWGSPVIQQLLADDSIEVTGYPRADALVALYPFLSKLVVPRGAADLVRDHPPSDVTLVGTKASLIVRKDLHPAIQYLLLQAAQEIHRAPSIFNKASEFPAAEGIDVALSSEAQRFYKSGLPFLHDYLPFWMASLVAKLIILLIPIFGVLYPVLRILPQLYDWIMRSKILRMQRQLRSLKTEIATAGSRGQGTHEMIARIDRMEEQAKLLRSRIAYAMQTDGMLSVLQDNIHSARESVKAYPKKVVQAIGARAE
jgi:TRAP transporter TAXI family solute receptor